MGQIVQGYTPAGLPSGTLNAAGAELPAGYNQLSRFLDTAAPSGLGRARSSLSAVLAGTRDARWVELGDSTSAGAYGAGVIWAGCRPFSPPAKWAAQLAARGLPVTEDSSFGLGGSNLMSFDPRISATSANWTVYAPGWMAGDDLRNDTDDSSRLSYQFVLPFDTIDVYYLSSPAGGSFSIGIDGSAPLGATVNTVAALNVIKVTRTCRLGIHRLDINRLAGAGPVPIQGVVVSDSTTRRVHVWNWGAGGSTVGGWIDNSTIYNPFPWISQLAPDFTIINLGINDMLAGTVPATFATSYQTLITECKKTGDVACRIPNPLAVASATQAVQDGINLQIRTVAAANGCPVLEFNGAAGTAYTSAVAAGYFLPANDVVHPGPTGYALAATLNTQLPGLLTPA